MLCTFRRYKSLFGMERLSLILATLIAAAQLSETYLRRTALTRRTSTEVKRQLWLGSALWSVASIVLYKSVFDGFVIMSTQ